MQHTREQLQELLQAKDWSFEQKQWMLTYLSGEDTSELRELLQQEFRANTAWQEQLKDEKALQLLSAIHAQIRPSTTKIITASFWKRIAVAAGLILVLAASFWIYTNTPSKTNQPAVAEVKVNDIQPGGNKAVLTLDDGSVVVLDEAQNGTVSKQGNTSIQKLEDGKLAYNSNASSAEVLYNTVSTPRGGQYQMTLADGSKVWLNAASSLRFPVAFNGKERKVELTGEAYFEVAKNKAKPFKVIVAGKSEVEVLGTHFNVNAYADEASAHTTLLEGKVKVSAVNADQKNTVILTPGEQSQFYPNGTITKNASADIEAVMAWKNGKFNFGEEASIEMVMRQIARWYDVEVEYKGTVKGSIGGSISRNVNASKVLQMLEMTGAVKFKMEGKKVVVMAQE